MAQSSIEDTGGLFVAVEGDDENYIADFALLCEKACIPAKQLDPNDALEIEPALSRKVIASYFVQDASIDLIVAEGATMVPVLENTRFIRAYSGVRPLFGSGTSSDDRQISRSFALLDHAKDGVENFASITGGKLTTYRLMAEKTADLICRRLGIQVPCRTKNVPLSAVISASWTQPGLAPKLWMQENKMKEVLLCECEMVSSSIIDRLIGSIREQDGKADLESLGVRSRIGKGACQGTFCKGGSGYISQGKMCSDAFE
jgi:glycerol-3-phosphate dehydrogenase